MERRWSVLVAIGSVNLHAKHEGLILAVTMTNDPTSNAIQVYDARNALLQTLSTRGKGGVGGNARGVQYHGEIFAAVNNGSNSVAVFRRQNNRLKFEKIVTTTSAPVSIDFGNDHMYVAGATTVDSFEMHGNHVGWLDGTTWLQLAGGGLPPNGSTAQIGVVDDRRLLVTLKTDPDPGTVDIVALDNDSAVTGALRPPCLLPSARSRHLASLSTQMGRRSSRLRIRITTASSGTARSQP